MARSLLLALLASVVIGASGAKLTQALSFSTDGHTGLVVSASPAKTQSMLPGDVRAITIAISTSSDSTYQLRAQLTNDGPLALAVRAVVRLAAGTIIWQGPLPDLLVRGRVNAGPPLVLDVQLTLPADAGNSMAGLMFRVDWLVTAQLVG